MIRKSSTHIEIVFRFPTWLGIQTWWNNKVRGTMYEWRKPKLSQAEKEKLIDELLERRIAISYTCNHCSKQFTDEKYITHLESLKEI